MHFVIAGRVNCAQFVYASMLAQRLRERLPNFTYTKIAKKSGDWEKWLLKTCKDNSWYHIKSPIIWREISMKNGQKYLIGDVTKFLDLCQDYYGLTRSMITGEIFDKAELDWFVRRSEAELAEEVRMEAQKHLSYRCRKICITGAGSHACDILVLELLHLQKQNREHGMEIRLYDELQREKKLRAMADDAKYCLGYSGLGCCRVVTNLKDAFYNVDLVIVMDSFPRREQESVAKWLKRNRNAMCVLGMSLNKYARTHCRVIIGGPSSQPLCYNANVVACFATKLHVRNIVAVTQDLGRETLKFLAKTTGIDLKDFYCPPVWGFVGLNKYIDLRNTLYNCSFVVPGSRVSANIPQRNYDSEIKVVGALIQEKDMSNIAVSVAQHKVNSTARLGHRGQLCKVIAILDLLKLWHLKQEDGNGEIISLGVYSDGTFNIPEGLYWSQPVTLVDGFWKPYARYPIPKSEEFNLCCLLLLGMVSIKQTKVGLRKESDKKDKITHKKKNKFDVDTIRNEIKIPVVRLESECLSVLKKLAKDELGIDFGARGITTVSEESEESIESVPQEQIYCECWRQEILQLKKMIVDKPSASSTEVEVNLSDALSGSEWSVINPPEDYNPEVRPESSENVAVAKHKCSSSLSTLVICECEDCSCLDKIDSQSQNKKEAQKKVSNELGNEVSSGPGEENTDEKHPKKVTFDPKLGPCSPRKKKLLNLYGMKDAIVNEERRQKMLNSIKRYEANMQADESGESESKEGEESTQTTEETSSGDKFHFSLDGQFEIVGDNAGLEALEEIQKFGFRESDKSFKEMWEDVVVPTLNYVEDSESTSTDVVTTVEAPAIEEKSLPSFAGYSENYGEGDGRLSSMKTSETRVSQYEMMAGESAEDYHVPFEDYNVAEGGPSSVEEVGINGEGDGGFREKVRESSVPEVKKRWLKGIPKCCLCHCIIPEGELGCHCGETKVVEVFKRDSEEIIMDEGYEGERSISDLDKKEIDDEISKEEKKSSSKVATAGVREQRESKPSAISSAILSADEDFSINFQEDEYLPAVRDASQLPPESFLPFSPKPINKFMPSEMPNASGRVIDMLPPECKEVLYEIRDIRSKSQLGTTYDEYEMEGEYEYEIEDATTISTAKSKDVIRNFLKEKFKVPQKEKGGTENLAFGYELEFELDESRMTESVLLDYGIKRISKQKDKSFQDWFEDIHNRCNFYYEVAAEEVSDEEFETANELKQYFED